MDDFETFKASREKMDPTSRKMSEHQWQQAYKAYRKARKRVSGSSSDSGEPLKKRTRSKSKSAGSGVQSASGFADSSRLRRLVRDQSAYADLRLMVDILAWVAIGVVILAGVVIIFYSTSVPVALASLLSRSVQVIGIIVARLLIQVLIDIPDIALYRMLRESSVHKSTGSD